MAHMISKASGEYEFAYHGEKPWHGLGTEVPGLMTVDEALRAARMDWKLKFESLVTGASFECVEGYTAIMRDDISKPIGIVRGRYQAIDNREAFSIFDLMLGEGQARIETAGALGNGNRVFMTAKLPDAFEPIPGDVVEPYIAVTTGHDGMATWKALFTSTMVVCHNTLTLAIKEAERLHEIRHTRNADDKMRAASTAMASQILNWSKVKEVCKVLAATSVSRVEVASFIDHMFPVKQKNEDTEAKGKIKAARSEFERIAAGISFIIVHVRRRR